jgi:C-terminal processing protease CtpA/Prc
VLRKVVPQFRKRSAVVYAGMFNDGIGYILISTWSRDNTKAFEQAYLALRAFSRFSGLIVDVRPNGGGAEPLAQEFAGCFVDKPVVYAKHVYRAVDAPDGFTQPRERVLQPNKNRPQYRGKVAVLMGQANMSSCEAFLLMMKQVPRCKLIGARSYGSSGNPKPTDLGNGVTVLVPSWRAMTPQGKCFEGQGISPDIPVAATPSQLESGDPVVQAALEWLRTP